MSRTAMLVSSPRISVPIGLRGTCVLLVSAAARGAVCALMVATHGPPPDPSNAMTVAIDQVAAGGRRYVRRFDMIMSSSIRNAFGRWCTRRRNRRGARGEAREASCLRRECDVSRLVGDVRVGWKGAVNQVANRRSAKRMAVRFDR